MTFRETEPTADYIAAATYGVFARPPARKASPSSMAVPEGGAECGKPHTWG